MSLAFQGGGIFASGLTPLILTSLLAAGGGAPWLAAGTSPSPAWSAPCAALRATPLETL